MLIFFFQKPVIVSNAWTAALLQIQSRRRFPLSPVINIVFVDCLPLVIIAGVNTACLFVFCSSLERVGEQLCAGPGSESSQLAVVDFCYFSFFFLLGGGLNVTQHE